MAADDSTVDALLCISEGDMEQNILPMPQLTQITTPTPSPRGFRTTRHMKTLSELDIHGPEKMVYSWRLKRKQDSSTQFWEL